MAKQSKAKATTDTLPAPAPTPTPPPLPSGRSPLAWSKATGNRMAPAAHNPHAMKGPNAMHAAAASLHGWGWFEYHFATEKFLLSESNYLAALEAAGKMETHAPALAPHYGAKLEAMAEDAKGAK